MPQEQLIDPADAGKEEQEKVQIASDEKKLGLSVRDLQPIPKQVAVAPDPFDGYPMPKRELIFRYVDPRLSDPEVFTPVMMPITWIVVLSPTVRVHQDPSGLGINIKIKRKDIIVDLESFHSRVLPDYGAGRQNTEIVFDRELILDDGPIGRVAIVKSHWLRAQICFFLNSKTNRMDVDDRYLLLDTAQVARLRTTFQLITNPSIAIERLSRIVTGEDADGDLETAAAAPLEN